MKKILFILGTAALLTACCNEKAENIEQKVESTLSQMTLDEKIALIHAQS